MNTPKALVLLIFVALSSSSWAKPPIGIMLGVDGDSGPLAERNDLEGGIWEYKVIDRKGDKQTMLVGKLRIKESAAFDVPQSAKGKLLEQEDPQAAEPAPGPLGRMSQGGSSPQRLGVLDRISESNRGGERIGDVKYQKSRNSTSATPKVTFEFDTDDDHILSGVANVKYDTRNGGGVWRGSYDEKLADGKKRRWTFEMRAIED